MSVTHKDLIRRLYHEVWNLRRLDLIDQVIAESHALNDPTITGGAVGPAAYKRQVERFLVGFPDLQVTVEDTISEKEKAVVAWNMTATHQGEFLGVSPSNKKVSFNGITINEIANGKILESHIIWDTWGLLHQLGVAPQLKYEKHATVSL
jgi:steroid delta-isomerase-like uncharacterized protein